MYIYMCVHDDMCSLLKTMSVTSFGLSIQNSIYTTVWKIFLKSWKYSETAGKIRYMLTSQNKCAFSLN